MRGSNHKVQNVLAKLLFQFTPLHERQRRISYESFRFNLYFNSRLYMRGSLIASALYCCHKHFNSRLYMRGSLCSLPFLSRRSYFNSRLYMRGSVLSLCAHRHTTRFQFTPLHERQLQKYTIFSIKSTQFSTKPCFFIVTSRKVVFFSIPVQYFL